MFSCIVVVGQLGCLCRIEKSRTLSTIRGSTIRKKLAYHKGKLCDIQKGWLSLICCLGPCEGPLSLWLCEGRWLSCHDSLQDQVMAEWYIWGLIITPSRQLSGTISSLITWERWLGTITTWFIQMSIPPSFLLTLLLRVLWHLRRRLASFHPQPANGCPRLLVRASVTLFSSQLASTTSPRRDRGSRLETLLSGAKAYSLSSSLVRTSMSWLNWKSAKLIFALWWLSF